MSETDSVDNRKENQSSYPSITESIHALANMWVEWNCHELDADKLLFNLEKEGYFLDAISLAWANRCNLPVEEVKQAWIEEYERLNTSPTTKNDEP